LIFLTNRRKVAAVPGDVIVTRTLLGSFLLLWAAGALLGCHCGREATTSDSETPTAAAADPLQQPAADEEPRPSAEVQALIDGGDAAAIAADLEKRSAQLGELAAAASERARAIEVVAESMTGRETPVDPRKSEDLQRLNTSALDVSSGAVELDTTVADMRQLVIDLQAEAEALYGRPAE